jgi:6-phosphogluconolactonase
MAAASAHHPPNVPLLLSSHSDADALVESLASFVAQAQRESIDKKGKFTVALSGGSLPKLLRGLINNSTIKWNKW